MIRGLIFDFDGLILETETPVYESWRELFESFGAEYTRQEYGEIIGASEYDFDLMGLLEQRVGRKLDRERIEPARRERELEMIRAQQALPGVVDYLQDTERLGLMLAVASSSSCDWVTGHLERLGLRHYFDAIVASDDVAQTKPDPALFDKALEELGLRSNEAIVFEDSPNGIRAAKRAGLFCVAVPNALTRDLPLEGADLRLDSLADLPLEALLEKIEREFEL